jgi:hypothetical protein
MENMLYARIVKFLEHNLAHRGCEDGWYACPKSEDYIKGNYILNFRGGVSATISR